MNKDMTITVSSSYKPRKWEILKVASTGKWNIVTNVRWDNNGYTLDVNEISLSKWRWIRKFQMWIIGKIFKS